MEILAQPGFESHDQWEVQVQAQVQLHADVYIYSQGLTDEEIRAALLTPVRDLPTTLMVWRRSS
jgi:lactate racemase